MDGWMDNGVEDQPRMDCPNSSRQTSQLGLDNRRLFPKSRLIQPRTSIEDVPLHCATIDLCRHRWLAGCLSGVDLRVPMG